MKITLITTGSVPYALGLRVLSSVLKKAGHEVKFICMKSGENYYNLYTKKELSQLKELCKKDGLIGLDCFSSTYLKTKQVIAYLNKELKVPIIFGGIHATLSPESCINDCDIVCVGEGEEAIVEVANAIENKKPLDNIKNIWIKKDGKIIKNEVRDLIDDLDKLPFPDFDIKNHYILDKGKIRAFEEEDFKGVLPFMSGRGCPYGCAYCSNGKFNEIYKCHRKRIVRNHSVDYSIKFLRSVKDKFKVEYVKLVDDTFTFRDIKEIKDFCNNYKKYIGIRYTCIADARTITEEKVKELVDSGCFQIAVGVQGSERVNKEVYHRYIDDKTVLKAAKILNKYKDKLSVNYDVIVTNPYEGPEDILEVFKMLKKLPKPFRLSTHNLVFFIGSQLYERRVSEGSIKNIKDTAIDLDYYDRGQHILRKGKNIYLYTILSLTRGVVTDDKYGSLKVSLLDKLLQDKYVKRFNDKNKIVFIFPYLLIAFDFLKYKIAGRIYDKMPFKFREWYINRAYGKKIFLNDTYINKLK